MHSASIKIKNINLSWMHVYVYVFSYCPKNITQKLVNKWKQVRNVGQRDRNEKHFAAEEGNGPWDTLQTIAKTIENNQKCIEKLCPVMFYLASSTCTQSSFGTG